MATERQKAANRANARKSTGPKSASGKARSARNATRHGLTAKPDPASVATWARIILNDPNGHLNSVLDYDMRVDRALDLAGAEYQLARAAAALQANESDDPPISLEPDSETFWVGISKAFERGDMDVVEVITEMLGDEEGIAEILREAAEEESKRLKQYYKGALSHRRRAFRAWLSVLEKDKISKKLKRSQMQA